MAVEGRQIGDITAFLKGMQAAQIDQQHDPVKKTTLEAHTSVLDLEELST
jgi:hypothetical protein